MKEHPELPEGQADYAIILAKLGKYREAMPHSERALAAGYRDPVLYNYLGISYGETGEQDKAREAYQQAVALNPGYAAAYLNLALLSRKQNQRGRSPPVFPKDLPAQRDALPPVRGTVPVEAIPHACL